MATALVTGGAGFIGSHLTERLLRDKWEVLVIDDLSTGSIDNLRAARKSKRLHVTTGSIENEQALAPLVKQADAVFHLAAAVGVKLIVDDPVHTIETNIHGTEVVLKCAAEGRKKVLLASTSEVYGKGSSEVFSEEDDLVFGATTRSRWCYGCSKAIDEFLALAYHGARGLPVVILRLFNTVGARQTGRYGMVLPRFVQQALAGGPISVYGDGEQVRCFTHVADVVEAFVRLAACEAAIGQIFNVGSDQAVSVNELAERVRKLVNPKAEIQHVPYEQVYGRGFEDIRVRVPDVRKLRDTIGLQPGRTLDQIIFEVKEHLSKGTA
jgi:UDP-glucose 4-epimerase